MKYLLTITLLLLSVGFTFAQKSTVKGQLLDSKEEAIPYANVALYNAESSQLITGATSDASGKFTISTNAGKYFVKISAIGFETLKSEAFTLSAENPTKNFKSLRLQDDVQVMDAVEVKALRPEVIVEADKMVVSVEGTAMAAGSSAYDVLEKSPGVFIDQDGNIQLNGKAGVQIMIDGRLTYMSATDLQNLLQGMSAENLKNIEIINNPSAKYDAEGNAGIINITLKKNTLTGMNGSVYAGSRYNGIAGYNAGTNLNLKKGDWNSFITADMSRRGRIRDADFYREIEQPNGRMIFDQDATESMIRNSPNLRIGTDYDINENHSVGTMVNVYTQFRVHDLNIESDLSQNGDDFEVISQNDINNKFLNGRANLHYIAKLDTNGTQLRADLNYVKLLNRGGSEFNNRYFNEGDTQPNAMELFSTNNPSQFDIYSAKLDFETKLGGTKLETGLKASSVRSDNDLQFYIHGENSQQLDTDRSNHFIYTENILAAYSTFSGKLGEKLSYKAGLRAEQTYSLGNSLTLGEKNRRDYFNLFPSVFLMHNVSKGYQVNYSYSRRIDRPRYDNLNPFVFYIDPYTWAQGNPNLRPQLSHNLSVTQTFMGRYNLVLNYSKSTNFISEIPIQDPEQGTTIFLQSNLDDYVSYSATAVLPFQPFKWWSINSNLTLVHQDFDVYLNNELEGVEQTTLNARMNNTWRAGEKYRIELNADYRSRTAWAVYDIDPMWGVDVALKRSFMDDRLNLSVNFTDIFASRVFTGNANLGDNINKLSQYFNQRAVGISLRYNFSKGEKFKSKNRNTQLDELNRAGG